MVKIRIPAFIATAILIGSSAVAANVPSGEELLRRGRIDDAVSVLQQQLASNPANSAELYHSLCRANYAIGKFDAAVAHCEKAVSLSPKNSEYHLWLGRAYGEKAEKSPWFTAISLARKTREHFETAVQLNGANVEARTDLAEFYLEAPAFLGGGSDKARGQADAIASSSKAASHWVNAKVAEKTKDLSTAENEFKAAIATSGNKPEAWIDLAGFYRRQSRFTEMQDAIDKAIAAQKKPGSSYVDAASLLLRAGRNLPQAAKLIAQYLDSGEPVEDAPVFRAHYLLGQILEKQGDRAAAAKEYEAALGLSREYAEARQALDRLKR